MLSSLTHNKRGVIAGVTLAIMVIILDLALRVAGNTTSEPVAFNTDTMRELDVNDKTYLGDEDFNNAFNWLIELRQQRLDAEQKKQRQAAEKKAAKNNNQNNQNKNETNQQNLSALENYQVTVGEWQITLKGIFFADAYFAVIVQQQGGQPAKTQKLRLNDRVGPFVVEEISEKTLTLGDTNNNQQHVLKLFKQD